MANRKRYNATAATTTQQSAAALALQVQEEGADNHSLSFPDKTWQVIDELAAINTNGNRSRLLALLAHQAAMIPEAFGLKGIEDEKEPTAPSPKGAAA